MTHGCYLSKTIEIKHNLGQEFNGGPQLIGMHPANLYRPESVALRSCRFFIWQRLEMAGSQMNLDFSGARLSPHGSAHHSAQLAARTGERTCRVSRASIQLLLAARRVAQWRWTHPDIALTHPTARPSRREPSRMPSLPS